MVRQKLIKLTSRKFFAAVAAALLIATGGVVFALLQSQAKLAGNTIETGTAGLLISTNGTGYMPSYSGYDFAGIVAGSQDSKAQHIFLENSGNTSLALKIAAPAAPSNPEGVDLSKVYIILTPYDATTSVAGTPQSFSLQSLIDADATGGATIDHSAKLAPGSKGEFDIQVGMAADAVNGPSAKLSNLDLVFTGVSVAN